MSQPVDDDRDPDPRRLTLSYDGANYQGQMPARELSVVLESLSDLVQGLSAADALGGQRPTVRVQAFRQGSFEIVAFVEAVAHHTGYALGVAGAVGTAFAFWWKNMRNIVVAFEHDAERGTVKVTMRSGETLEWTEQEWRIYNNRRTKRAVRGIAEPLRKGAELTVQTQVSEVTVPASDAYLFEPDEDDEPDREQRLETWVSPDTVSFDPAKRWRLWSRVTGGFSAVIEDTKFTADVQLGRIRIGRNDSFKVALRTVTTKVDNENDRVRWFIERVIEHQPGAEQLELTDGADQEN